MPLLELNSVWVLQLVNVLELLGCSIWGFLILFGARNLRLIGMLKVSLLGLRLVVMRTMFLLRSLKLEFGFKE